MHQNPKFSKVPLANFIVNFHLHNVLKGGCKIKLIALK